MVTKKMGSSEFQRNQVSGSSDIFVTQVDNGDWIMLPRRHASLFKAGFVTFVGNVTVRPWNGEQGRSLRDFNPSFPKH
jgi:hypothetical protein